MVDNKNDADRWKKVRQRFTEKEPYKDLIGDSPDLANWNAAAITIVRFNEIKSRPHTFNDTVRGKDSVEDAIKTIKEEWEKNNVKAKDDLQGEVTSAEDGANKSAGAWKDSVESLTVAWKAAGRRFEQGEIAAGENLDEQTSKIQTNLNLLEKHAPDSKVHLNNLFQILIDDITPAITEWETINRDYTDEAESEKAEKLAAERLKLLGAVEKKIANLKPRLGDVGIPTNLQEKAEGIFGKLVTKFEGLAQPGALKPKVPVNEALTIKPADPNPLPIQTGNTTTLEKVSIPRTYIVLKSPEGDIDLSGVEEIKAKFPESFSILHISTLKGEVPEQAAQSSSEKEKKTINDDKIYSKGTLLFSGAKDRKLKIEKSDDLSKKFWEEFPGSFLLQFPETEASTPEFRIAVIEIPASTNESKTTPMGEHAFELPLSKFLKRSDKGEVSLTKDALAIAEHLVFPEDAKPSFELILSGDYQTTSREATATNLLISPLPRIEKDFLGIEEEIKQNKSHVSASENFEGNYGQLGQMLFPEFFSIDGIQSLSVGRPDLNSKDKAFRIGKIAPKGIDVRFVDRKPVKMLREFTGFEKEPLIQNFKKYVKSLFDSLDELSRSSSGLNSANKDIQKFIENSSDLKETKGTDPALFGWIKLAEISREAKWSTLEGVDPSAKEFLSELEAKDALEKYMAEKYFSDFFLTWEDLFSPEKAEELFDYLLQNRGRLDLTDTELQMKQLLKIKAIKPRFTNTDLSDDGVYSLNVVYEFKNPNSPTPIRQVIPLIGSAPAAN